MNVINLFPIQFVTGIIDFATSKPILRPAAWKLLEQYAYHSIVENDKMGFPEEVQRDKAAIVASIIHSVEKGLSRELIGPNAHQKLLDVFLVKIMSKPKEILENFARQHGVDPPGFMTISPTARCNLNCHSCYASSDATRKASLPYQVFERILNEKVELWGSHFTVISGGEPFLYKDSGYNLMDIFENHPDQYFLVYTNGTLITADTAQRLGELGNITPAISVEGLERETDQRRGKGVFKRILISLEHLRRAGVPFGISVTAMRDNCHRILDDEFIDFFEQEGMLYEWIFQYMPIGRGFTLETMVTPEQRLKMYIRTWELIRERKLFIADFWNCGTASNGCIAAGGGIGGGYFYIDWNGAVAPCVFNPFSIHNIKDVYAAGGNLNTVIFSPLFESVRRWQRDYFYDKLNHQRGNLITPCPIRDHHQEMRSIIDNVHAEPIDENGRLCLEDYSYGEEMAAYGKEVDRITYPIWKERYL